jgi:CxxC motif-containing protein (DUF1111 family)
VKFLLLAVSLQVSAQDSFYPHNAVTCERCHNEPEIFGGGPMIVERKGRLLNGRFVPSFEGGIHHRNGESAQALTAEKAIGGDRVSLSLLGDGYIELNARRQRETNQGITGVAVAAPLLEVRGISPVMEVGRFGWKSQHSSLLSSCADSLRNELGIRNRLYSDEYPTHASNDSPTPFDRPDPKTGKTELERLVDEIRRTAPPPRDETLAVTPAARSGEELFTQIGCAICHVTTYKTAGPGTRINAGTYRVLKFLGSKVIHPYSDFLLHDVGTGDGIPQAAMPEFLDQSTANKFRTPPLWGLRFRATHLMHDGDTPSAEQAIKRHAGEASQVRDRYEHLNSDQKSQLLTFLSSL